MADRSDFQEFVDTEVQQAVERSLKGVSHVIDDAVRIEGALSNSGIAFPLAEATATSADQLLTTLLEGYERAMRIGRPKPQNLKDVVRAGLLKHQEAIRDAGALAPAFNVGSRNASLQTRRAEDYKLLLRRMDDYFAGFTAPLRPHWTARHPIVWALTLMGTGVILTAIFNALTGG